VFVNESSSYRGRSGAIWSLGQKLPGIPVNRLPLETVWTNPPTGARLRAYGAGSTEMSRRPALPATLGEGGELRRGLAADVAYGAEQSRQPTGAHGATFFSAEWRAALQTALHEANRVGLEIEPLSQSGWNLTAARWWLRRRGQEATWSHTTIERFRVSPR